MNSNVQDDTIDLKELFFSLISEWKVITLCILLSIVSAIIYLRTTENVYQTDALVQIKSNKSSPLAGLSSDMAAMASLAGLGGMGCIYRKSPKICTISSGKQRRSERRYCNRNQSDWRG